MGERLSDEQIKQLATTLCSDVGPGRCVAEDAGEVLASEALARGADLAAEKEARQRAEAEAKDADATTAATLSLLRAVEQQRDNLLARIRRDGGQYAAEHGTAKAVADADEIVARLYGERDALKAQVASATDLAVQAEAEVTRARGERDEARAEAAALRAAVEPAFTEYLGNDDEPVSLEAAFAVFRDSTAGRAMLERVEKVEALLRRCLPHVRMAKSITSGRDFRDAVEALVAALAPGGKGRK